MQTHLALDIFKMLHDQSKSEASHGTCVNPWLGNNNLTHPNAWVCPYFTQWVETTQPLSKQKSKEKDSC